MNKNYPMHKQFEAARSTNDEYCDRARATLAALKQRPTLLRRVLLWMGVVVK